MSDNAVETKKSGPDSEKTFDMSQYEKKKVELCKQAVLADTQYQRARGMMRDIKRKEIKGKKEALRNGTDPEYVRRKQEILDEAQKQRNESRALFLLEKESAELQYAANKEIVPKQFEDARQREKEKLIERLERELLEVQKREAEERVDKFFLEASSSRHALPNVTKEDSMECFPEEREKAIVLQSD